MNSTNSTADTEEFRDSLRANAFFILDTLLLVTIGPFAFALQLFFMLLLYQHFTIHHANVRLFMWNLSMSLSLQSLYFIINGVVNILYLTTSVATFNFDVLSCQLTCILSSTAALSDMCSTFGMGVDRLYATLRRNFDDPKRSGILCKLLVFGTWSITAVVYVYALIANGVRTRFQLSIVGFGLVSGHLCKQLQQNLKTALKSVMRKTPMKHYCHGLLYNVDKEGGISSSAVLMVLEVAGIGLPVATLLISRRMYRDFGLKNSFSSRTHTLQQRFALSNNVTVSLILLPLDVLRSVAYIQALIILIFIRYTDRGRTVRGATLSSLATFITVPLACACPISCMYMDKRLGRAALGYWNRWKAKCGRQKGAVAPDLASSSSTSTQKKTAVISRNELPHVEMRDLDSRSQMGSGKPEPSRYKSVVADCVVNFKTNPERAQDIIVQLWDRQAR